MKILITILSLTYFINSAFAAETLEEKASAKTNDVKRTVKSTIHRVEEKVCDITDKSCVGKKIHNRSEEIKDYTKDKTNQVGNALSDKGDK